jgi:hypothetical protein
MKSFNVNYVIIGEEEYDKNAPDYYIKYKNLRRNIRNELGVIDNPLCSEPPVWVAILSGYMNYFRQVHGITIKEDIVFLEDKPKLKDTLNTLNFIYHYDAVAIAYNALGLGEKSTLFSINAQYPNPMASVLNNLGSIFGVNVDIMWFETKPDFTLIKEKLGNLTPRLTFTVGCQYDCNFCIHESGRAIPTHQIKTMFKSIKIFDSNVIYIGDLSFVPNVIIMRHLLDILKLRPLTKFIVQMTVQDFIKHIHTLHNLPIKWVELGIESLDDNTLQYLNKRHSAGDASKAIQLSTIYNVPIVPNLMFGVPVTNSATQKVYLNNLINILYNNNIPFVNLSCLAAYKGNKLPYQVNHITKINAEIMVDQQIYENEFGKHTVEYAFAVNQYTKALISITKVFEDKYQLLLNK